MWLSLDEYGTAEGLSSDEVERRMVEGEVDWAIKLPSTRLVVFEAIEWCGGLRVIATCSYRGPVNAQTRHLHQLLDHGQARLGLDEITPVRFEWLSDWSRRDPYSAYPIGPFTEANLESSVQPYSEEFGYCLFQPVQLAVTTQIAKTLKSLPEEYEATVGKLLQKASTSAMPSLNLSQNGNVTKDALLIRRLSRESKTAQADEPDQSLQREDPLATVLLRVLHGNLGISTKSCLRLLEADKAADEPQYDLDDTIVISDSLALQYRASDGTVKEITLRTLQNRLAKYRSLLKGK
jgi:hypothetical protein